MNRLLPRAAGACAIGLFAIGAMPSASFAAAYSESVDGELPSANPITLITLDPGLNTVSGTFGNVGFPTDYDSFAFMVPGGMSVAGAGVELADNGGNIASGTWELRTGAVAGAGAVIEEIFATSPGADAFAGVPSGTFHIGAVSFGFFEVGRSDYTFSFNVVPEPASASLLAAGALALAAARRRRR